MTDGVASRLATPAFLEDVLSKELVPLNSQTDTDFILAGGITIRVRQGKDHILLGIDRVPDYASFIVNHPTPELKAEDGATLIKRLFELALIAVRKDRANDVANQAPNRALIGVLQEAMLLSANPTLPGLDRRAVVLLPSPIQHAALASDNNRTEEQQKALLSAVQPLLTDIDIGGLGFEPFNRSKHFYSELNGVEFIFSQDSFAAVGGVPQGVSTVEFMKMLRDYEGRVKALGYDPDPILTAITS